MRVDIRFLGIRRSRALADHARQRVKSQLDRPEFALSSVTVRLDDTNGPKGGVCKACYVVARGPSLGEVHVKAVQDSIYNAVGEALERVQRSLSRRAKRLRGRPRTSVPVGALEQVMPIRRIVVSGPTATPASHD